MHFLACAMGTYLVTLRLNPKSVTFTFARRRGRLKKYCAGCLLYYISNKASLFAQSAAYNNAPGSSFLITHHARNEAKTRAISFFYGVAWLLKI